MSGSGAIRPIEWHAGTLSLLDQTRLPQAEVWCRIHTVQDVVEAIRRMRVRGAPAIGVVAAAGVAIAARAALEAGNDPVIASSRAAGLLESARPTAVNLHWAVRRAQRAIRSTSTPAEAVDVADALVTQLLDEQWASDRALSAAGAALLPPHPRLLTHCNTGPLATGGYGTALGIIRAANESGGTGVVYVGETRPRLQGARLTAWELMRLGVPFLVIVDSAAGSLMARNQVDAVVVGADRIAANGDVANKIGTYPLAVLAAHHGVPFYVAAPVSTIDPASATGGDIPIEERDADELRVVGSERITPEGARALNPAFDVTPASLVTALVTERGVLRPPYDASIARLVREAVRDDDPGAEEVGQTTAPGE